MKEVLQQSAESIPVADVVDSEDIVEEGEQKSETDGINSDQSTEELQQMAESTYLLRKVFKSYWCTLMNILYIYRSGRYKHSRGKSRINKGKRDMSVQRSTTFVSPNVMGLNNLNMKEVRDTDGQALRDSTWHCIKKSLFLLLYLRFSYRESREERKHTDKLTAIHGMF